MKVSVGLAVVCALLSILAVYAEEAELLHAGHGKYGYDTDGYDHYKGEYGHHPKGDYYPRKGYGVSDKYRTYGPPRHYKPHYEGPEGYSGYHGHDGYYGYEGPEGYYGYERPEGYYHHDEEWSCEAGKGGPHCDICPANTYSTGGKRCKCSPCGTGLSSPKGSTSKAACIPTQCAARNFKGIALPANGNPVVLSDVPKPCNEVPGDEQFTCLFYADPVGNYYFIEKDPTKDRVIAVDMCAQRNDQVLDTYFDYALTVYPVPEPVGEECALDTSGAECNDWWGANSGDVYDRAEQVCDSPGDNKPYLEVTLAADTNYVVFGYLGTDECSEYTDLDLTPTTSVPFITTIKVTEVDGVPVGGRKKMPVRKTPAKKSPAELEERRKQQQARKECLNKAKEPIKATPDPAKATPAPAKTAPKPAHTPAKTAPKKQE